MTLRLATRLLLFFALFFGGLVYAKLFLVPIAFAGILAMLALPLANWLERKGIGKSLATALCLLTLLLIVATLFTVLGWQVSTLLSDLGNIEQKILGAVQKAQGWISETVGISPKEQQQMVEQQQQKAQSSGGGIGDAVKTLPGAVFGALTNILITLVYLFLFLRFRLHLKRFVLKVVPEPDRRTALDILHQSSGVVQKYLTGMGGMILCLWVMYGIGFSIAGVQSAVFFAILCGTLELIPFVGNIAGTSLTLLVSLTQSNGGSGVLIGILITYAAVQAIQSYILEPLVVGRQVKLHPLFTILIIVLGELLWGIPGMVLAVPLLGIAKIICDRVPSLQPYGYLIGEEENVLDPSPGQKIIAWARRRFRRA